MSAVAYDYDTLYGETPWALGEPTPAIVAFFEQLPKTPLRVLDVGCGQGRDALFIARLGHHVLGVDLSANGIGDLTRMASRQGLPIEGVVADIVSFVPDGDFDVVLIDRTLHMLTEAERLAVLARLIDHVVPGGLVLIADEPSNMAGFRAVLEKSDAEWDCELDRRGHLFVRRR